MRKPLRLLSTCIAISIPLAVAATPRDAHAAPDSGSPRAPRLYLTSTVLQRLQQRAAASDPAWTALKAHCDLVAGGTYNVPSGPAYPDLPGVGQGYEGDGYGPEIKNLGLCYRVELGVDDASAAIHGAAGARLLEAIATPVAAGGQDPSTDDGYGIRNYGVAMATGFDWLYPALSAGNIADVVTSLDAWVSWFDANGFTNNEPIGNYFQGYLLAKTATAIATVGDNPSASTYWSDVQTRMWGQLAKPQFAASMSGGGWPEGWEYGPLAVENYTQFLYAASTGEQMSWWGEGPNAHDEAAYITYFAWPSRLHMDDQGTVYSQARLAPSGVVMTYLSGLLADNADPYAATARSATAAFVATNADVLAPWESFLYWDSSLPLADYTLQPLSYFASGPNHVAVRSTWSTDAVWGSFVSGTYIDAPDSGEQLFNQGSVAVVSGDQPILVNPTGWLPQADGAAGEDAVYADAWSNETRLLANTFYVAGTKQGTAGPTESSTHVLHYEEGGSYVHARGSQIEGMYLPAGTVSQFTRDFVYLRPGTFVVYDRTTAADGTADQWTAWHTPTVPTLVTTSDATQRRFDISAGGAVVGSVRSLLPENAASKVVSVLGTVSRIENHAATPASATDWLTVVTAGSSVPDQVRLSPADGNVLSGASVGVLVLGQPNSVVLFASDHAAAAQLAAVTYAVTQTTAAGHVIVDVAPSPGGYAVSTALSGGRITVTVTRGGPLHVTGQGTLAFTLGLDGSVTAAPPPASADGGSSQSGSDSGVATAGADADNGQVGSDGGQPPPAGDSGASANDSNATPGQDGNANLAGSLGAGCAASGRSPDDWAFGCVVAAVLLVVSRRRLTRGRLSQG